MPVWPTETLGLVTCAQHCTVLIHSYSSLLISIWLIQRISKVGFICICLCSLSLIEICWQWTWYEDLWRCPVHFFVWDQWGQCRAVGGTETWLPTLRLTVNCWLWALHPELTRALVRGETASPCSCAGGVDEGGIVLCQNENSWEFSYQSWASIYRAQNKLLRSLCPVKMYLDFNRNSKRHVLDAEAVLRFPFQGTSILEFLSKAIVGFIYVLAGT